MNAIISEPKLQDSVRKRADQPSRRSSTCSKAGIPHLSTPGMLTIIMWRRRNKLFHSHAQKQPCQEIWPMRGKPASQANYFSFSANCRHTSRWVHSAISPR